MKKIIINETKGAKIKIGIENYSRMEAIQAMLAAISHLVKSVDSLKDPTSDPPKPQATGQASLFIQE